MLKFKFLKDELSERLYNFFLSSTICFLYLNVCNSFHCIYLIQLDHVLFPWEFPGYERSKVSLDYSTRRLNRSALRVSPQQSRPRVVTGVTRNHPYSEDVSSTELRTTICSPRAVIVNFIILNGILTMFKRIDQDV